MADTIVAKVYRYDPSVDTEPYFATYEVPFEDTQGDGFMTGLQVLHAINETQEAI